MTELENSAFKEKAARVPFVGDLEAEAGAVVVSAHDGRMYAANEFGWNIFGETENKQVFFFTFDGAGQMFFLFRMPIGTSIIVDIGDGSDPTVLAGNDNANVIFNSAYTVPGQYTVTVYGDLDQLTHLQSSSAGLAASVSAWGKLPSLKTILFIFARLYGNCEYWLQIPTLEEVLIYLNDATFSGDVSKFGAKTAMTRIRIESTGITFSRFGDPWTFDSVYIIKFGGLSSADINNAIAAMKTCTNCEMDLTASEGRTVSSDADIVTLAQNNNLLFVGEKSSNLNLDVELHTDANAASDPNGNEADDVTGWTPTGLDPPNEFISQNVKKYRGRWAIKANANPNPTSSAGFTKTFASEVGEVYRGAFAAAHVGDGGSWRVDVDASQEGMLIGAGSMEEMVPLAYYLTMAGATHTITFRETTTTDDGGVYFDDFSLRKILP